MRVAGIGGDQTTAKTALAGGVAFGLRLLNHGLKLRISHQLIIDAVRMQIHPVGV